MSVQAVLLPVFVQVALTFVLLFWQGRVRVAAIRQGETKIKNIALREPNWPPHVLQVANSYSSQFEVPLLFYVLVALAILTQKADVVFVVLAWLFALSRIVHAYIHTTSNNVPRRFQAFATGATVLLVMWVIFAARVLLAL